MSETMHEDAIVAALNAYDGRQDWREFDRSLGLRTEDVTKGCIPISDGRVIRYNESVRAWEISHLWPCGCLVNDAGAHRVGCPDHPAGVDPRRSTP